MTRISAQANQRT